GKEAVVLWDVASGKKKHTLATRLDWPQNAQFSNDGALFAVLNRGQNIIEVWDVATGKALPVLRSHTRYIDQAGQWFVWSPDGQTMALVGSYRQRDEDFGEIELLKVPR